MRSGTPCLKLRRVSESPPWPIRYAPYAALQKPYVLTSELIKNSRRSDREIAKAIGVSQPTVSRLIKKLEKERLLDYTSTPDLRELGFEILAFTFGNWHREGFPDTRVDEMRDFISRHPNIIFVSTGTGLGWDRVGISVHKD